MINDKEALMCGYINLLNLTIASPAIGRHPIFKMALVQIEEGIGEEECKNIKESVLGES